MTETKSKSIAETILCIVARSLLAGLLSACSGPTPNDPIDQCSAETLGNTAEGRTAELGTFVLRNDGGVGGTTEFERIESEQELMLVRGLQGGYMLTPSIRVNRVEADPEQACFTVALRNELDGGAVDGGFETRVRFRHRGDFFLSDALSNFLGSDEPSLVGKRLRMALTVRAPAFEASDEVAVILAASP